MKIRLSNTAVRVIKFEAKLLLAVLVGSFLLAWALNAAIYTVGEKIAVAYTTPAPLFK